MTLLSGYPLTQEMKHQLVFRGSKCVCVDPQSVTTCIACSLLLASVQAAALSPQALRTAVCNVRIPVSF